MIFLDTSFIVAEEYERDENHAKAVAIRKKIESGRYGHAYISDYIFDESATLLLARTGNMELVRSSGDILRSAVEILRINEGSFDHAWELFKAQKGNKPLSFTDCTNIAVMEEHGINNIVAFDGGFDHFGVNVVDG